MIWCLGQAKKKAEMGGWWETCSAIKNPLDPSLNFQLHRKISPSTGLYGFFTPCFFFLSFLIFLIFIFNFLFSFDNIIDFKQTTDQQYNFFNCELLTIDFQFFLWILIFWFCWISFSFFFWYLRSNIDNSNRIRLDWIGLKYKWILKMISVKSKKRK